MGSKSYLSGLQRKGSLPHCLSGAERPPMQLFNGTSASRVGSLNTQQAEEHRKNMASQSGSSSRGPAGGGTYMNLRSATVAINAGVITTYSGSGELKWQV